MIKKSFTLIELILVIAILGILATLLVPQVSQSRRTANMTATITNQKRIAELIQTHYAMMNRYPDYMDSLTMNGNAIYAEPRNSTEDRQNYGLPRSGPDLWKTLEPMSLSANQARSLIRSGISTLFAHNQNAIDANESNSIEVKVAAGINVAVLDSTRNTLAGRIINDFYGWQGTPRQGTLVAFGFGNKNSALGTSALQAPLYPGCDGSYYGRYIVVYCIYETGKRATLAGVIDSYGRTYNYTSQQLNESLPEGARRD